MEYVNTEKVVAIIAGRLAIISNTYEHIYFIFLLLDY
jgi:hypothetical protein